MATIDVLAGSDLQAALDAAQPGDELVLEPGVTFVGQFELPEHSTGSPVTVRGRAMLVSNGTSQPALKTRPKASGWTLKEMTIQSLGTSDVLRLGSVNQSDADLPRRIVCDGLNIQGGSSGAHRGIAANAAELWIRGCTISNVFAVGIESQGICAWNTPGPILIEDCHIEAGSIGTLFGGAEPSVQGWVPSRITYRRNVVTRPLSWRSKAYACKNLFELKNASDVLVYDNHFSNNWNQGQNGFAILFTPRGSGPNSPWSRVSHVRFRNNLIEHVGGGVNLLGRDYNNPSQPQYDVQVTDNEFRDINQSWGGSAGFLLMVDEPHDVTVSRNIVQNNNWAVFFDSNNTIGRRDVVHGFEFCDNTLTSGTGLRGNGVSTTAQAIQTYCPSAKVERNRYGVSLGEMMYEPETGKLTPPPSWESGRR